MKTNRTFKCLTLVTLLTMLNPQLSIPVRGADVSARRGSDKAIEQLKRTGHYDSLSAAVTAARYGVKTSSEREGAAMAANPAHDLFSTFTSEGLRLRILAGHTTHAAAHTVNWRLESIGYGGEQMPVAAGELKVLHQRVELVRSAPANLHLTEWFENTPAGLEHGFTLFERPMANARKETLRLVMAVTGDLTPHADAGGQSLGLRDTAGRTVVSYEKLKVWDATGQELPATMRTEGRHVLLCVNEATARYPLTIDPTFVQQAFLRAENHEVGDSFGSSVGISGDTVIVGAPDEDGNGTHPTNNVATDCGAAYIFVRNGTNWTQQAYLKGSTAWINDRFGASVAISSNTAVVGSIDNEVFVFRRTGTNWAEEARLVGSNTEGSGFSSDRFGVSVAVDGTTIVVGAPFEDSNATGVNGNEANNSATNSGAAYVFIRFVFGGNPFWSQQAYLKASNTGGEGVLGAFDDGDNFGTSVAISGDTIVIGAPEEDSPATGVYAANQGNDASGQASGAAYVFTRSSGNWSEQAYFKASNSDGFDHFGACVAISSNTMVVGAPDERSNATGVNGNQNDNSVQGAGAVYVFQRSFPFGIPFWTQQAYLKPLDNDADDNFGNDVGVSGDKVVVGMPLEDSGTLGVNGDPYNDNSPGRGAAYVYVRNGSTWSLRDYLKSSISTSRLGVSVAVDGDTVLVGAPVHSSGGAVFVFEQTYPEIVVEQPLGVNIPDGGTNDFTVVETNALNLTLTIRNIGNDALTGLTITNDGPDSARFTVIANPVEPVAAGASTTFTVRFTPQTIGATYTAALHIANNDKDEHPFDITLKGYSLTFTNDTDGDDLNDAAELLMSPLGFNWKIDQPALVGNLFVNANAAGLFTKAQLQALAVDSPLLEKNPNGFFKLTIGVQKATQLTNFVPFPMTAPQTTINGQGKLEFEFNPRDDDPAFFRLEAR